MDWSWLVVCWKLGTRRVGEGGPWVHIAASKIWLGVPSVPRLMARLDALWLQLPKLASEKVPCQCQLHRALSEEAHRMPFSGPVGWLSVPASPTDNQTYTHLTLTTQAKRAKFACVTAAHPRCQIQNTVNLISTGLPKLFVAPKRPLI